MQAKFIGVLICLAGVLAVAAVPTATSRAQHCGTPVVSVPYTVVSKPIVHHNQVVVKEIVKEVPIAVPVLVPAFQFQYSPPCQVCPPGVVGQQPGYVPGYGQPAGTPPGVGATPPGVGTPGVAAPPVPVATPGQPAPPAPSSNDRIRELAKALLEEMQRQSGQGPDDGPPTVYDPSAPKTAPTPPAPVGGTPGSPPGVGSNPPGVGNTGGMTREQAAPYAIAALNRNCAQCHTGVGSKGDFTIFQQPGLVNPNAGWRSILREIESGRMPPKQSQFRLTPEETNAIRTWLSGL